jgi:DNA-binding CsgD family transcriptional regulator
VLQIERRTVRTHLLHIYKKLGVDSHVEAVVKALKAGLLEP